MTEDIIPWSEVDIDEQEFLNLRKEAQDDVTLDSEEKSDYNKESQARHSL